MKKKILFGAATMLIAVVALLNVNSSSQQNGFSDLSLANVQALSQELDQDKWSSMSVTCFDKYGNVKGSYIMCFHPGASSSCTSTSC